MSQDKVVCWQRGSGKDLGSAFRPLHVDYFRGRGCLAAGLGVEGPAPVFETATSPINR